MWNGPRKVCRQIRQNFKIGILKVFLEYNIVVQSIQSHLSHISSYNITNRGTDQSALTDTSKRLEIAFGIMFAN